ncbi:hypothetical protein [Hymenobacter tenuis]
MLTPKYSLDMFRSETPAYYLSRAPRGKKAKKRDGFRSCVICAAFGLFLFMLGCLVQWLEPHPLAGVDKQWPTPKNGVSADIATTSK